MKKVSLWLGAALMAVGCSQGPKTGLLQAEISGMTADDSVLVRCGELKDSLAAPNGVFTYEYTDTLVGRVMFYELPKRLADGRMEAFRMNPLVVLMQPGQTLKVTGSFDKYEISGNEFYSEYNAACQQMSAADSVLQIAKDEYMQLMREKAPKEEIMSKFAVVKDLDVAYKKQVIEYVANHLDSDVALYLLYLNSSSEGAEYMSKFSDKVKNGPLKEIYQNLSSYYVKMAARKKAAEAIQVGKIAPDFTLKNLNGEDVTLSSLRGKYVVLDFWGSWCGWCIKGFPDMKKMYAKYQGKLEVVGIDCRDTEDKWKAAVAKHELPWVNVINSTEEGKDLTTIYNVGGFPTKVIISPKGEIVDVVVGERPDFYDNIKKLMKK